MVVMGLLYSDPQNEHLAIFSRGRMAAWGHLAHMKVGTDWNTHNVPLWLIDAMMRGLL